MPRETSKPVAQNPQKEHELLSQYHAVGPAAIAAALQCKADKPAETPRPSLYTTQTD